MVVQGTERKNAVLLIVASLMVGLIIPVVEWLVPQRYPAMNAGAIIRTYTPNGIKLNGGQTISISEIQAFLEDQQGAVALYGRALYPSFYASGKFWGEENDYIAVTRGYDRLQFYLTGPDREPVFIPLKDAPGYFPHGSDVVVLGCESSGYVRALAVVLIASDTIVPTSPWPGLTCDFAH